MQKGQSVKESEQQTQGPTLEEDMVIFVRTGTLSGQQKMKKDTGCAAELGRRMPTNDALSAEMSAWKLSPGAASPEPTYCTVSDSTVSSIQLLR